MTAKAGSNSPVYVEGKLPGYVTYRIGIFGWRKRCLYFSILLVLIMAVINMTLIVWIIRAQDFGLDGIGKLYITNNGIKVEGVAEFVAALKLKELFSNEPLYINSRHNLTLSALDKQDNIIGQVVLDSRRILLRNKELVIKDHKERTLLQASDDKIAINLPMNIRIPGGLKLNGNLQASSVGGNHKDFRLHSRMGKLKLQSEKSFNVNSYASRLKFVSGMDVNLLAVNGKISVSANTVRLKNVKKSTILGDNLAVVRNGVSEVCMCGDGMLFLAPPKKMYQCKASNACF